MADMKVRLLTVGHGTAGQPNARNSWLPAARIAYRWEKRLGGFRKLPPDSPDIALRNESFRAYAAYMRSSEFLLALDELITQAAEQSVVIMCSEKGVVALPSAAHRRPCPAARWPQCPAPDARREADSAPANLRGARGRKRARLRPAVATAPNSPDSGLVAGRLRRAGSSPANSRRLVRAPGTTMAGLPPMEARPRVTRRSVSGPVPGPASSPQPRQRHEAWNCACWRRSSGFRRRRVGCSGSGP
jgi:hypothetical protein